MNFSFNEIVLAHGVFLEDRQSTRCYVLEFLCEKILEELRQKMDSKDLLAEVECHRKV